MPKNAEKLFPQSYVPYNDLRTLTMGLYRFVTVA